MLEIDFMLKINPNPGAKLRLFRRFAIFAGTYLENQASDFNDSFSKIFVVYFSLQHVGFKMRIFLLVFLKNEDKRFSTQKP